MRQRTEEHTLAWHVDVHICIYNLCIYILCVYIYLCVPIYMCVYINVWVRMCVYICMCVYYTSSWGNITGLTCTLAMLVKLHQHNFVSIDTNLSHFIEFTLATSLLEWTTMKHLSIMNLVSNYLTQFLHPAKLLLSDRLYHLKKKIPQQVMTKRRK